MVYVCGRCGYEVPEGEIQRYTLTEEELLEHLKNVEDEENRTRFLAMGAWRCPGCGRVIRPMMIDEALKLLKKGQRNEC